jgi:hypothetical protein
LAGEISFGLDVLGVQGVKDAAAANPSIIHIAVDQAGYDTATAKQVIVRSYRRIL